MRLRKLLEARASAAEAAEKPACGAGTWSTGQRFTHHCPERFSISHSRHLAALCGPATQSQRLYRLKRSLIASLEIPPTERDGVYEGLEVKTEADRNRQLGTRRVWRGTIMDVSPDLKNLSERRLLLLRSTGRDRYRHSGRAWPDGLPRYAGRVLRGLRQKPAPCSITLLNRSRPRFRRGAKE